MHISISFRILGMLLMMFSLTMIIPMIIAVRSQDGSLDGFVAAFAITFISGLCMWIPVRNTRHELRIRDGFLVTALFWSVLGIFGSLPFMLADEPNLFWVDAVFESVSGLTTTGATVMVNLDSLPRSILFYRQQLQWLGGIGIIVIAIAILPMLGIGGMQLYKAETPGPSKNSKLTPRITETAKVLFLIYLFLTAACAISYWLAGMTPFDAVCHAFSTVAIGGFSTHDASIGYFDSDTITLICTLFMFISAINFGLHFTVWRGREPKAYFKDPETLFFCAFLGTAIALTCAYLMYTRVYNPGDSMIQGLFQAVSITTTTGFTTANFAAWPTFLPILLLLMSFMGGCVGSTGGGLKAMRVMLVFKQGVRELKQLVHPNAVIPLKVGNQRVDATVVSAVWSFFSVYVFTLFALVLTIMATGQDFISAFSAVVASLNNLGPGLGEVAANYSSLSDHGKWVLAFAMLLGRLEIFTLLVIFTPTFWRT